MSAGGNRTPTAHFESFAEGHGWNASFREPCRERTALVLDEVIPLLRDAEGVARAGMWVALALSYEAAPAFDSALEVKPSSGFPLAWMANVVVFSEGKYWTPPREAGLLAGTLREELISKGQLFERTITKRELTEAGRFALINSVRGWMQAELSKATRMRIDVPLPVTNESDIAHPR